MSADQAADLLGVRLQTIYAYVSRGLLTRTHRLNSDGHRVSGFEREEVLRLAAERTRVRTGSLEVLVETDVTLLDPKGALAFRGHDAVELAARPFEEVAALVWGAPTSGSGWALDDASRRVVARAADLPPGATDVDRVRAAVVALAGADPDRDDVGLDHVTAVGRRAVAATVYAVGSSVGSSVGSAVDGGVAETGTDAPVAERLWAALGGVSDGRSRRMEVAALDAALVLLLDHELAASTMAARIAAGTGADPWLVLLAGLAALGGPRHGRSSVLVEQLLGRLRSEGLAVALKSYASSGGDAGEQPTAIPGFGHKVYLDADPRAEVLLDHVARLDPEGWPVVEELLLEVSARHGLSPNVDLALAALVQACEFRPGSGETVFATSRMVGWLAHASEEYPRGLRFRPRAVYTGDARP